MTIYTLTRPKVAPPKPAVSIKKRQLIISPKPVEIPCAEEIFAPQLETRYLEAGETILLSPTFQPINLYCLSGTFFIIRRQDDKRVTTYLPQQTVWPVTTRDEINISVKAVRAGELAIVEADKMAQLCAESAAWRNQLLKGTICALDQLSRTVQRHSHAKLNAGLANLLLILAENDEVAFTHEQIADMLDTYRETVTTMLNRFRRLGWVSLKTGTVYLEDVEKLRGLSADF